MKHSTETGRNYHHLALVNIEHPEGLHRQKRFVQLRDLLNILHRDLLQFRVGKDPSAIHRHFLYATATVASLCKPHQFAADYRRLHTVPRSALQSKDCKHAISSVFMSRKLKMECCCCWAPEVASAPEIRRIGARCPWRSPQPPVEYVATTPVIHEHDPRTKEICPGLGDSGCSTLWSDLWLRDTEISTH